MHSSFQNKKVSRISVEGDSKWIIDVMECRCGVPWRIQDTVEDIRGLASFFHYVTWKHIYPEANFMVDAINNVGLSLSNMDIWDRTLPLRVFTAFMFDCNSIGCSGFLPSINFLFEYKYYKIVGTLITKVK